MAFWYWCTDYRSRVSHRGGNLDICRASFAGGSSINKFGAKRILRYDILGEASNRMASPPTPEVPSHSRERVLINRMSPCEAYVCINNRKQLCEAIESHSCVRSSCALGA